MINNSKSNFYIEILNLERFMKIEEGGELRAVPLTQFPYYGLVHDFHYIIYYIFEIKS